MDQQVGGNTQWEDILIQKKIIESKKVFTEKEILGIAEDVIAKKNNVETKPEDFDEEDDEFFQKYKNKIANNLFSKNKQLYSQMLEISSQDFKNEVTLADPNLFVFVHMYKNEFPLCERINEYLDEISKFNCINCHSKFIKIISDNCIENFLDSDLPRILVYRSGQMVKQNLDLFLKSTSSKEKLNLYKVNIKLQDLKDEIENILKDASEDKTRN